MTVEEITLEDRKAELMRRLKEAAAESSSTVRPALTVRQSIALVLRKLREARRTESEAIARPRSG